MMAFWVTVFCSLIVFLFFLNFFIISLHYFYEKISSRMCFCSLSCLKSQRDSPEDLESINSYIVVLTKFKILLTSRTWVETITDFMAKLEWSQSQLSQPLSSTTLHQKIQAGTSRVGGRLCRESSLAHYYQSWWGQRPTHPPEAGITRASVWSHGVFKSFRSVPYSLSLPFPSSLPNPSLSSLPSFLSSSIPPSSPLPPSLPFFVPSFLSSIE